MIKKFILSILFFTLLLAELARIVVKINFKNLKANKYLNMSVDELKSLNYKKIDDAINSVLYFNECSENIGKYNTVQLTAITIKCFYNEVNNGGLCQFFTNSSRCYAPYVADSLKRIGAEELSNLFKSFVNENNIDLYDLSSFDSDTTEEYQYQTKRYEFDSFDDSYNEYEDINELLIKYVKDNIDTAFLPV